MSQNLHSWFNLEQAFLIAFGVGPKPAGPGIGRQRLGVAVFENSMWYEAFCYECASYTREKGFGR